MKYQAMNQEISDYLEDEHEMFERDGKDIFMLKDISLLESFKLIGHLNT